LKKPLRIIFYLLISLSIGILFTLIIDYFENFAVEKSIRKDLEQEIRSAAASFKGAAGSYTPDEVLHFLTAFSASSLRGKIIAVDPVTAVMPGRDSSFLFSYNEGEGRIDYYIVTSFLEGQKAILDLPELLFGLFTTIAVFAGIVLYQDKRGKFQELRQHLEVKHEEIRRVLEEHEALALLGRMAATLAHELKTPVATISNLIQVFPSRIGDKAFTDRFPVMINEELSRTQQLINNLLAYGKEIDAGQAEWVFLPSFLTETAAKNSLLLIEVIPWDIHGDRFYLGSCLTISCGTAGRREPESCGFPCRWRRQKTLNGWFCSSRIMAGGFRSEQISIPSSRRLSAAVPAERAWGSISRQRSPRRMTQLLPFTVRSAEQGSGSPCRKEE
jgi:hypothetical protein